MTSNIQISTFSIQILSLTAYISYTAFEQKDYYAYTYDIVLLLMGFLAKRWTGWSQGTPTTLLDVFEQFKQEKAI